MLIIHGDNEVLSRADFLSQKTAISNRGQQIITFSGDNINYPDLLNAVDSASLFGDKNVVFIENIFSSRPSKDKKNIQNFLSTHQNSDIFIWENKDISKELTKYPPKIIKKYDLPKYLFNFIDGFQLSDYRQASASSSPEQIFALLSKRIHDLILYKDNPTFFPPWQQAKLLKLGNKYTSSQLSNFNQGLLEIDFRLKNSLLPYDLNTALELWIISI